MEIKAKQAAAFLGDLDPAAVSAILLYGSNSGLVRERAAELTARLLDEPGDPFRFSELSGADLEADPARLADEAASLSMTGGQRVVRVHGAGNKQSDCFRTALEISNPATLIVAEAGELAKTSSLRKLFEKAKNAAAIGCHAEDSGDVRRFMAGFFADSGLKVEPGAAAYLEGRLGADRMTMRTELEKLALYCDGTGAVTLEAAEAVVGDTAAHDMAHIIDAALTGNMPGLDAALARHYRGGGESVSVLRALAGHVERLQMAAPRVRAGASPDRAMSGLRPPVFFMRQDDFRAQLRLWPPAALSGVMSDLLEAQGDCMTTGNPARALCGRTLMRLARRAGAAARARR